MVEAMMRGVRRTAIAGAAALALAGGAISARVADEGPIKVGVLHSLSGTMAISETTLKDVILMLVDDLNAKGGLLGRKVEAVVVDPASDWPLFAELDEPIAGMSDHETGRPPS